ncbi:MAG TPA: uroporphyrinogen-III C-methyltransferase [Pyrinomonadaceae bacterium]|nr:uroporphyrinogen-III C-methyltransferase [Pyrinomonadaceae bacterium]
MRDDAIHGVLVIGHGSRRPEANDDVRNAAQIIGERGGFPLVEAGFLEIEQPDVAESFKRLLKRGASRITVHPYFLSPGRHTRGDLPLRVSDVARRFPGVSYQITEPLSAHPLVIEASIARIRETAKTTFEHANVNSAQSGVVYLVGAGPGDPQLLTLRGRDLLASCDVVLYDYLVDPDVLNFVSSHAERIYVGKVGRGRHTSQTEINQLLIEHARAGERVVRLKGGDPFLFGRGGEEALALSEAGIPFEVVPGVSSALAVPAYAGIPLTHRGTSSSVAIISGASAGDLDDVSATLADLSRAETIVVLMGISNLRLIADDLIACGREPETPVAIIRWGTYETQQTVTGTLASIADDAEKANMRAPAVIVVGEVVRLREHLNWSKQELVPSIVQSEPVLTRI